MNLEKGNIAPIMENNDALRRILYALTQPDPDIIEKNFNISSSGSNEIIGAISGQIIGVYAVLIHPAAAVTLTMKSAGNAISPALSLSQDSILILDEKPSRRPWYRGAKGGNIDFSLSGGVSVVGTIYYKQSL